MDKNIEILIDWLRRDPNNFSYWFPCVRHLDECGVAIPRSVIQPVPDELLEAFYMANGDGKDVIAKWVHETVMPLLQYDFPNQPVFLKNGCFSNKFNFNSSCLLKAPIREEDLLKQIILIQHYSLCFDTSGNMEMVFREVIPAPDSRTIYNGMPLRPEMRVFYDFGNHDYLYDVNYWDWDYCHDGIANHNWEDGNTYEEAYPSLVAKYTERRETFLPVIKNALKTVEGLGEIWSVDFILDNDKVWLIDMARGKQSAYWDDKKIYGINNCK